MTLQRLDNETLPEAILAVLRVLHKNPFPPPLISIVWDLTRGLVDFCLKEGAISVR